MPTVLSRRRFLSHALAGVAVLPVASAALARSPAPGSRSERWLELLNTHTGETVSVAYRSAGGLVRSALGRLDWLLRDHRAGEQRPMDAALFDQLADLAVAAGHDPRFEIISGYRSPRTNERLAAAGRGVARRSLHMEGRAVDVRLRGVACAELRDLAIAMQRGGVGYYASSDFVHLDTGRVRRWIG